MVKLIALSQYGGEKDNILGKSAFCCPGPSVIAFDFGDSNGVTRYLLQKSSRKIAKKAPGEVTLTSVGEKKPSGSTVRLLFCLLLFG